MANSVFIETHRLILRTVTMDDVEDVASSWQLDGGPISRKEAEDKVIWMLGNHTQNAPRRIVHLCLAIIHKDTQEFIGWCGLDHLDQAKTNPVLFYLLQASYWGKGLATEAARAVLVYGFSALDLARIDSGAALENIASKRVMEKIGMRYLGLDEEGGYSFTLTKEEYSSGKFSTITLPLPFRLGSVNCYLLQAGDAYVLIDTGAPNARHLLTAKLQSLGCQPGSLHLTVLTHGDFDHTGNAAYLRLAFGSKIAMHADDARMAEVGDMFVNRQKSNLLLRALTPRLIGFGQSERFIPDVLLEDGCALSDYGLEARVVWLPGHSRGSIGILTPDGDLFCGDLFDNTKQPALNSLLDDRDTALQSAAQLRPLQIGTVYPGHGQPFSMDQLETCWKGEATR